MINLMKGRDTQTNAQVNKASLEIKKILILQTYSNIYLYKIMLYLFIAVILYCSNVCLAIDNMFLFD